MTRYRVALWSEDRLLVAILACTAALSAWIWWVPIRAIIEGTPFQWSNEFGVGRLAGKGMGGDFLVLALVAGFFISVIYSGWRGGRGPFKATILFWTVMNLVDSAVIIANDPAGYQFRGDTWGIDLNLATFMPALKALLVLMVATWLFRDARAPRVRSTPPWTPRNWLFLWIALACVPISATMLRLGPMHDITDRIGWTLTVVEWLLLNLAFLPWVPVAGLDSVGPM